MATRKSTKVEEPSLDDITAHHLVETINRALIPHAVVGKSLDSLTQQQSARMAAATAAGYNTALAQMLNTIKSLNPNLNKGES